MLRLLISAASAFLPWALRRPVLEKFLGYKLHPDSRIGFSLVACQSLVMEAGSRIGHLSVIKGLESVRLGTQAIIGNLNWITGFPLRSGSSHFAHQTDRCPELVLGEHAAISNRHLIDCTARVVIGAFATFAGYRSQILTHSIDLQLARQSSAPITIGEYSFVGTDCVLLGGCNLPARSVLGAKSLLNKSYTEELKLYAGVPARPVKDLPSDWAYFQRKDGFVH